MNLLIKGLKILEVSMISLHESLSPNLDRLIKIPTQLFLQLMERLSA